MADARQEDQFGTWNHSGKIFGVLALDELIVLGLYDRDWHLYLSQVTWRAQECGALLVEILAFGGDGGKTN